MRESFKFIKADGSRLDVRVIAQSALFSTARDVQVRQAAYSDTGFVIGSGKDASSEVTVTVFITAANQSAARLAAAGLQAFAADSIYLARIALDNAGNRLGITMDSTLITMDSTLVTMDSATEAWYRALVGNGMSVASKTVKAVGHTGKNFDVELRLRPLYGASTLTPIRDPTEYANAVGSAIMLPRPTDTSLALLTEDGFVITDELGAPILVTFGPAPAIETPPGLDFGVDANSMYIPLI